MRRAPTRRGLRTATRRRRPPARPPRSLPRRWRRRWCPKRGCPPATVGEGVRRCEAATARTWRARVLAAHAVHEPGAMQRAAGRHGEALLGLRDRPRRHGKRPDEGCRRPPPKLRREARPHLREWHALRPGCEPERPHESCRRDNEHRGAHGIADGDHLARGDGAVQAELARPPERLPQGHS